MSYKTWLTLNSFLFCLVCVFHSSGEREIAHCIGITENAEIESICFLGYYCSKYNDRRHNEPNAMRYFLRKKIFHARNNTTCRYGGQCRHALFRQWWKCVPHLYVPLIWGWKLCGPVCCSMCDDDDNVDDNNDDDDKIIMIIYLCIAFGSNENIKNAHRLAAAMRVGEGGRCSFAAGD